MMRAWPDYLSPEGQHDMSKSAVTRVRIDRTAGPRPRFVQAQTVGLMFWLRRNRLVGSYLFFKATRRS